jgi:serine protease Do
MKGRSILYGLIIAFAGAFLALFTYTRFIEKQTGDVAGNKSDTSISAPSVLTSLPAQQNPIDFTFAAEQTVHAVVHVKTKSTVSSGYSNPIYEFFYGETQRQPREVRGYGSGVIISSDGYIITNNHVIDRADEVRLHLMTEGSLKLILLVVIRDRHCPAEDQREGERSAVDKIWQL